MKLVVAKERMNLSGRPVRPGDVIGLSEPVQTVGRESNRYWVSVRGSVVDTKDVEDYNAG